MKRIFTALLFLLVMISAKAQMYKHSVGVRAGYSHTVTLKYFYNDQEAVELMAGERNGGLQITGLYQFNRPMKLAITDMLYAYYGAGIHVGYELFPVANDNTAVNNIFTNNQPLFVMGVNTILGVEYRWLAIPITIGLDVKPYFQMVDMRYGDTKFWDVGASVKYVF